MANTKKSRNMDIYKKRQTILLIVIGSVIAVAIIIILYFVLFNDNKIISQNINYLSYSQSDVPADAQGENVDNSKICFENDQIELEVGSKVTPKIQNGSIDAIKNWQSSDSSVAIVSENGEITGISVGICAITAEVEGASKILNLRVDVIPAGEGSSEEPTSETNSDSVTSKGYDIVVEDGITYIYGIMMASKTYSLPEDFDPGVNEEALNAFNEMQEVAAEEGLDIHISSSYRSYEDQERIYNRYVEEDGQEEADTYSSRPGHSDHQTGLTFDLNSIDDSFGLTPESDWLKVNAHKYGFIIRYPEGKQDITGYQYEPWHIRYLGIEKATEVYESGLCLEEFLGVDSVYKD